MGEVVARLDNNGGGFSNTKYLSDISDIYPVTFYKLSSPSMVGYLANMIPNILVFLFITGVPYLPVLGNATIIIIIFWRRKTQVLAVQLRANLEDREGVSEDKENIKRDTAVYRALYHPCI